MSFLSIFFFLCTSDTMKNVMNTVKSTGMKGFSVSKGNWMAFTDNVPSLLIFMDMLTTLQPQFKDFYKVQAFKWKTCPSHTKVDRLSPASSDPSFLLSFYVDFLLLEANLSVHGLQVHVHLVFDHMSGVPWMVSSLVDSHHPSVCMS